MNRAVNVTHVQSNMELFKADNYTKSKGWCWYRTELGLPKHSLQAVVPGVYNAVRRSPEQHMWDGNERFNDEGASPKRSPLGPFLCHAYVYAHSQEIYIYDSDKTTKCPNHGSHLRLRASPIAIRGFQRRPLRYSLTKSIVCFYSSVLRTFFYHVPRWFRPEDTHIV